jgi:cytoskeletal protein CcmA (bactofilin family)
MANTTFSGPVTSTNGFIGTITGSVTGPVVATTLSASGAVILSGLPTSDPTVAGQLWNNLGVLNVSAG